MVPVFKRHNFYKLTQDKRDDDGDDDRADDNNNRYICII